MAKGYLRVCAHSCLYASRQGLKNVCCRVAYRGSGSTNLAFEEVARCPVLDAHANEAAHHDNAKGSGEVKSNAWVHSAQQTAHTGG
jgi:hypothetical protein